jgi:hypothetical protein
LCVVALGGMAAWLAVVRPWRNGEAKPSAARAVPVPPDPGHVAVNGKTNPASLNGQAQSDIEIK